MSNSVALSNSSPPTTTPSWGEKTRILVLQGDFDQLTTHLQAFPKHSPLVTSYLQQFMVDTKHWLKEVDTLRQEYLAESQALLKASSVNPENTHTPSFQPSRQISFDKLGQGYTSTHLFADQILELGLQVQDRVKQASLNVVDQTLISEMMALHEFLIGFDNHLDSFIPSYKKERKPHCLTGPLEDYLSDTQISIPLASKAVDIMIAHNVVDTIPRFEVSDKAKSYFDPFGDCFINAPANFSSTGDTTYSSMDQLVMEMIKDKIQWKTVDKLSLERLDMLAQHNPLLAQSFEKIMQNPYLINQIFCGVKDQERFEGTAKAALQLQINENIVLTGADNPASSPSPLEKFYGILGGERGLDKLGAPYLQARHTKLSIERVVGQRSRGDGVEPRETPKKLI